MAPSLSTPLLLKSLENICFHSYHLWFLQPSFFFELWKLCKELIIINMVHLKIYKSEHIFCESLIFLFINNFFLLLKQELVVIMNYSFKKNNQKSYSGVKFKSHLIIHQIMNNIHQKVYNYMKEIKKFSQDIYYSYNICIVIFIISCWDNGTLLPCTCLKNAACLIIVYSFQFFSSISWQVSEYFIWIIRKDFTIINGY